MIFYADVKSTRRISFHFRKSGDIGWFNFFQKSNYLTDRFHIIANSSQHPWKQWKIVDGKSQVEWNLVPHSTAQLFLCCAVCCAVFENWILSAVKSCVITVQHFENCCEKVLYFGKNRQKLGFFEGKTSNQDNFVLNFVKNVDLFYILGASNLLSRVSKHYFLSKVNSLVSILKFYSDFSIFSRNSCAQR